MELALFDDFRLGVAKGDRVVDVSAAIEDVSHLEPHHRINRVIEGFDRYRPALSDLASRSEGVPLGQVRLRAPLPKPGAIICMAVNYMEDGTRAEPAPINAFLKSPRAVIGDGDTIILADDQAAIFEHEAELALVIGKRASRVKADDWRDYVFGYLNFIDVSSRGLGAPPMDSFFPTKSQFTSAPLGPYLVTADEIPDPLNLSFRLWVNGDIRQDYHTSDMAHKIARCIEWASSITTLEPGDVLATGTNHRGLGPLQDGDAVVMEIDGLGKLNLKVTDEQKRKWPRETRAQREAREAASTS